MEAMLIFGGIMRIGFGDRGVGRFRGRLWGRFCMMRRFLWGVRARLIIRGGGLRGRIRSGGGSGRGGLRGLLRRCLWVGRRCERIEVDVVGEFELDGIVLVLQTVEMRE